MRLSNYTLGLVLTGTLLLTASCGDEESGENGSSGGATSGGSTSTTGGSTSTTGGSTSTTGGSTSTTGGSTSTTGGTSSTGGTGPGAGCPDDPPADGGECTPEGGFPAPECRYTGVSCSCTGGGFPGGGGAPGGGMGEWNCSGDGDECPSTPPTDGDPCGDTGAGGDGNGGPGGGGLDCPYPTVDCTCGGFGQTADEWSCDAVEMPVECPDTAPEDGSACTGTGACPDIMCACFNEEWTCFGGGFGGAPQ